MHFVIKKKLPFVAKWDLSQGVTQSLLAEFLTCREKARLGYKEGWTSEMPSNALTFGTLLHNCLESNYKHLQGKKEIAASLENVVTFYVQQLKEEISKERLWTPEDEQQLLINQGWLNALLPAYWKKYTTQDSSKRYLAVEEEFNVHWSDNINFRGKIDIAYEVNGETWIMDHKTTSSLDSLNDTGLSFNFQGLFYILNWFLSTNILPSGFIQNVIKRPSLRQGKNENVLGFIKRAEGDIDESYFKRIQVTISKEEFEYWLHKEFQPIMDEFIGWAKGLSPNFRNPVSCETRYGSCKFLRICGLKDFVGLYQRKQVFKELV